MKKTFLTVLLFYIFTGIAVAQNLSKTTEYKILLTLLRKTVGSKSVVAN